MVENIIGNGAFFIEGRVLLKQGYRHFFIDPGSAAVGRFLPASIRSRVLFPLPLRATNAILSPSST
jgi:hypothetical protein